MRSGGFEIDLIKYVNGNLSREALVNWLVVGVQSLKRVFLDRPERRLFVPHTTMNGRHHRDCLGAVSHIERTGHLPTECIESEDNKTKEPSEQDTPKGFRGDDLPPYEYPTCHGDNNKDNRLPDWTDSEPPDSGLLSERGSEGTANDNHAQHDSTDKSFERHRLGSRQPYSEVDRETATDTERPMTCLERGRVRSRCEGPIISSPDVGID